MRGPIEGLESRPKAKYNIAPHGDGHCKSFTYWTKMSGMIFTFVFVLFCFVLFFSVISSVPPQFITFVLSENVFCQDMVVLLNPVCVLLSGMLHVYKSDVRVAVFETWWPPKHRLRSIENRKIVWTCIFEAAGSNVEGNISYNYRFHIVTRFKS